MYLFMYLLCIYLFIYLVSSNLFMYLFIYLFIYLVIYVLFIYVFNLYIYIYVFIYLYRSYNTPVVISGLYSPTLTFWVVLSQLVLSKRGVGYSSSSLQVPSQKTNMAMENHRV